MFDGPGRPSGPEEGLCEPGKGPVYAVWGLRSAEPIQLAVHPRTPSMMIVLAAAGLTAGCGSPSDLALDGGGPLDRTREIAAAAQSPATDWKEVDVLIVALDSDDSAERMLAITALNRLTGLTFGYDFAGSWTEREAAIGRWLEWRRMERNAETTTRPGAAGASAPAPGTTGDGA